MYKFSSWAAVLIENVACLSTQCLYKIICKQCGMFHSLSSQCPKSKFYPRYLVAYLAYMILTFGLLNNPL